MEVTDFQFNMDNRNTFSDIRILGVYEVCSPADRAPVLSDHTRRE